MLEEMVRRLQAAGLINAGEFEVEWPPVNAPGEKEKFELVGKLTAAMEQAFRAGLSDPLFDATEVRRVAGFEERSDDGMPEEGVPTGPLFKDKKLANHDDTVAASASTVLEPF